MKLFAFIYKVLKLFAFIIIYLFGINNQLSGDLPVSYWFLCEKVISSLGFQLGAGSEKGPLRILLFYINTLVVSPVYYTGRLKRKS